MHRKVNDPPADYIHPVEDDVERRRSLGIYYTPRSAAALLAKWAIRAGDDTILEPSFGGCTILEAAVARLRDLGCPQPPKQIFGFDVDESAFVHLRRLMGNYPSSQFLQQDFLSVLPDQLHVKAVIANPPFVSYHRMNEAQRTVVRTWRQIHPPTFPMTASLWAYFLSHSLSFLQTGGRLAFVLPFAASSSDYARPIRDLLGRRFASVALYRVTEQLFIQAGAEEGTVILLADSYLGPTNNRGPRVERSVASLKDLHGLLSEDHGGGAWGASVNVDPAPGDPASQILHRAMSRGLLSTLGDILTVSIGEVIGDTAYLVKSFAEWEVVGIPPRYLRPIVTRMRDVAGLRLTKEEVSSLYSPIPLLLTPPVTRLPKTIREYLDAYPAKQLSSNKTFAKRNPWYSVPYQTTASAFIGSMAHGSPKIVSNCAGISCANGLYKLSLRKGRPWRSLLSAVSLTTVFKFSAETHARVRGSGVMKLEPSDVRKLLIPAQPPLVDAKAARILLNELDTLLRRGEHESATSIADRVFYLSTELLSPSALNAIRSRLQDLRGERLL